MKIPRILIGATHSGTGKTTITNGIILALRQRGLEIQPFKAGPDYIDPGFHTLAAERSCRNLDTVMMGKEGVLSSLRAASADADIAVIEGVMGLFDGFSGKAPLEDRDGIDSAAIDTGGSSGDLAKITGTPVILCIDASAMSTSAAAVALGFQRFDPELALAGFIMNNVSGKRHFELVRQPVEAVTGLPVFGYLPKNKAFGLPERHLGLVPAWERVGLPESADLLRNAIETYIDLDRIIECAESAPGLPRPGNADKIFQKTIKSSQTQKVRIGYALDDAFHFYYRDNLDILESFGAELIPFSPIRDDGLPDGIGGIYLGGGYPELFGPQLERNGEMRNAFREAAAGGLPIYAECGGLMYLMEKIIDFDGKEYEMCGVFPGAVKMEKKLAALGYYYGRPEKDTVVCSRGEGIWGHVFHWSTLSGLPEGQQFAFSLEKNGEEQVRDGLMFRNVLAGYFHVHFAGNPAWAKRFVDICSGRADLQECTEI